jgi:hypothetical protein
MSQEWFVEVTYIDGTREEREIFDPDKSIGHISYDLKPCSGWRKTGRWVEIKNKKVTFPRVDTVGVRDDGHWEQCQIPIQNPSYSNEHIKAVGTPYYYKNKKKIYKTSGGKRRKTSKRKSRKHRTRKIHFIY